MATQGYTCDRLHRAVQTHTHKTQTDAYTTSAIRISSADGAHVDSFVSALCVVGQGGWHGEGLGVPGTPVYFFVTACKSIIVSKDEFLKNILALGLCVYFIIIRQYHLIPIF